MGIYSLAITIDGIRGIVFLQVPYARRILHHEVFVPAKAGGTGSAMPMALDATFFLQVPEARVILQHGNLFPCYYYRWH